MVCANLLFEIEAVSMYCECIVDTAVTIIMCEVIEMIGFGQIDDIQ